MAEVKESLIDQVGNQDQFTGPEETSHIAHDEAKDAQVVENEMGAHIGSRGDPFGICRPEMENIDALENEQDNPIDAGDQHVQPERRSKVSILSPDSVLVRTLAGIRRPEGVQDPDNYNQEPCDDGEDLVSVQRFAVELGPFGKRVVVLDSHVAQICHRLSDVNSRFPWQMFPIDDALSLSNQALGLITTLWYSRYPTGCENNYSINFQVVGRS